uniref:Transthyretin-like family protein n=1 Tax=Strongyloides stercoralis TaxID=6248 RepID=A0A0K0E6Q7_STRER
MFHPLILFLIFNLFISEIGTFSLFRKTRSTAVQGIVMCNGKPQRKVLVKLYEKDTIRDDLIDKTRTNRRGAFRVKGHSKDWGTVKFRVHIYHKCTVTKLDKCRIKYAFSVPPNFVSKGKTPKFTYKLNRIAMRTTDPKGRWGDKDCFH